MSRTFFEAHLEALYEFTRKRAVRCPESFFYHHRTKLAMLRMAFRMPEEALPILNFLSKSHPTAFVTLEKQIK